MSDRMILVVDDELGMRDMLGWFLSQLGYRIKVAQNGAEAAAIVAQGGVDVVVSDVTMPLSNGLALLRSVKDSSPGVAVILMTGFGSVETAVHAMKMGASDFLLKPFDPEILARKIEETGARRPLPRPLKENLSRA